MAQKQVFASKRYVELKEIKYISTKEKMDDEFIKDSYEIVERNANNLKIIYTRKILAIEEFMIEVIAEINRKPVSDKKWFDEKVMSDSYIKENIDEVLGLTPSFVSAVIASITGSFVNIPLITPPNFCE